MRGFATIPARAGPTCPSPKPRPAGKLVDLTARIPPPSQLDDHPPAPPVSASPLPLRRPPPVALENLALRHQLSVYKRTMTRPKLRTTDRLLWVGLARVWTGWRRSLVIVTPDTVLRWQRRRFREHWAKLSGRPTVGRPPVNADIIALVRNMAAANPRWGAPRIHGRTPQARHSRGGAYGLSPDPEVPLSLPRQTWRTFLTNHVRDLVSIDFFTVPTARLRVLFVLVVLAHHRRRVLHFNSPATLTVHRVADNHCKLDSAESESLPRSRAGSGDEGERTQARTGAATDLERRHDQ